MDVIWLILGIGMIVISILVVAFFILIPILFIVALHMYSISVDNKIKQEKIK